METIKDMKYLVRDLILILETDYCIILIEINYTINPTSEPHKAQKDS
jgi:hypothetical protein